MAVGMLSYSSYQSSIDARMREVSMSADYLATQASGFSEAMEKCSDRAKLRTGDELDVASNLLNVSSPVLFLTEAAKENGIGMYFVIYGKDDTGVFYLVDSESDYVMGSSMPASNSEAVAEAFEKYSEYGGEIRQGRSRYDTTSYRLVCIPSTDLNSVVGVIEVGTKVRAFDASVSAGMAQQLLVLLVMMLVVYLCINAIDAQEARFGKWRVATVALALLGVVFLLFSLNTTLVWSIAVVAIVAVLCKSADGWKAMWLSCADEAGVQAGPATGAMFAVRSLALVAQPFILGGLLTANASFGVIAIGALCALLFFFFTRRSSLPAMR